MFSYHHSWRRRDARSPDRGARKLVSSERAQLIELICLQGSWQLELERRITAAAGSGARKCRATPFSSAHFSKCRLRQPPCHSNAIFIARPPRGLRSRAAIVYARRSHSATALDWLRLSRGQLASRSALGRGRRSGAALGSRLVSRDRIPIATTRLPAERRQHERTISAAPFRRAKPRVKAARREQLIEWSGGQVLMLQRHCR